MKTLASLALAVLCGTALTVAAEERLKTMINNPAGAHFGVARHVSAQGDRFVQSHIQKRHPVKE